MCFLSYDFKNELEKFPHSKNHNPLQFPNKLCIEVEQKIDSTNLVFEPIINQPSITIKPTISKEEYITQFENIKQHIQQGDIYEINYCITFEAENVSINPFNLFQKLNSISLAPYSALAKLDNRWIICASPELFLHKKETSIYTKPIKGTAKRGDSSLNDEAIKQLLFNNHKERNENVMIVDVCRNDLSQIATKGSVNVDKLYDIESYQQVHQMVSTVSCKTKPTIQFSEILKATFPMASMTGAPKIKAMELADDYEFYNRNAYSGALGYTETNGDFMLNVLIRSIFYNEETKYLSFSVGSAVTSMANAEDEYEECLLKAKAMRNVLI